MCVYPFFDSGALLALTGGRGRYAHAPLRPGPRRDARAEGLFEANWVFYAAHLLQVSV